MLAAAASYPRCAHTPRACSRGSPAATQGRRAAGASTRTLRVLSSGPSPPRLTPLSLPSRFLQLYLVESTSLSWEGLRLASANASFFAAHALHDAIDGAALLALAPVSTVPPPQDSACAACPALAVWLWLCALGGAVLPLYALAVGERAAKREWLLAQQQRAGVALAAGAGGGRGSDWRFADCRPSTSDGGSSHSTATDLDDGCRTPCAQSPPRRQLAGARCSPGDGTAEPVHVEGFVYAAPSVLPRTWPQHVACALALSSLCWVGALFVSLTLAPRLLPRHVYAQHCPVLMPTPFLHAGHIHG